MKQYLIFVAIVVGLVLFISINVLAQSPENKSSANYSKAKHLLPGEDIISPTGQKYRVWSTEGPVPVSQAPEPYAIKRMDGSDNMGIPDQIRIIVDGRARPRRPQIDNAEISDTFDRR